MSARSRAIVVVPVDSAPMGHTRRTSYLTLRGQRRSLSDYIPDVEKRGRGRPRKQGQTLPPKSSGKK